VAVKLLALMLTFNAFKGINYCFWIFLEDLKWKSNSGRYKTTQIRFSSRFFNQLFHNQKKSPLAI
jgi:uncharacterized membrane protein